MLVNPKIMIKLFRAEILDFMASGQLRNLG